MASRKVLLTLALHSLHMAASLSSSLASPAAVTEDTTNNDEKKRRQQTIMNELHSLSRTIQKLDNENSLLNDIYLVGEHRRQRRLTEVEEKSPHDVFYELDVKRKGYSKEERRLTKEKESSGVVLSNKEGSGSSSSGSNKTNLRRGLTPKSSTIATTATQKNRKLGRGIGATRPAKSTKKKYSWGSGSGGGREGGPNGSSHDDWGSGRDHHPSSPDWKWMSSGKSDKSNWNREWGWKYDTSLPRGWYPHSKSAKVVGWDKPPHWWGGGSDDGHGHDYENHYEEGWWQGGGSSSHNPASPPSAYQEMNAYPPPSSSSSGYGGGSGGGGGIPPTVDGDEYSDIINDGMSRFGNTNNRDGHTKYCGSETDSTSKCLTKCESDADCSQQQGEEEEICLDIPGCALSEIDTDVAVLGGSLSSSGGSVGVNTVTELDDNMQPVEVVVRDDEPPVYTTYVTDGGSTTPQVSPADGPVIDVAPELDSAVDNSYQQQQGNGMYVVHGSPKEDDMRGWTADGWQHGESGQKEIVECYEVDEVMWGPEHPSPQQPNESSWLGYYSSSSPPNRKLQQGWPPQWGYSAKASKPSHYGGWDMAKSAKKTYGSRGSWMQSPPSAQHWSASPPEPQHPIIDHTPIWHPPPPASWHHDPWKAYDPWGKSSKAKSGKTKSGKACYIMKRNDDIISPPPSPGPPNDGPRYCGMTFADSASRCSQFCTSDADCVGGESCWGPITTCGGPTPPGPTLPPVSGPVIEDGFCGTDQGNANELCSPKCTTDADCSGGLKCWPAPGCIIPDGICGSDQGDAETNCSPSCTSNADCTGGDKCFAVPSGCDDVIRNGYCGNDQGDAESKCSQSCTSDADCTGGGSCFDTMDMCKPVVDGYCGTSFGDAEAQCSTKCETSADCTGGASCYGPITDCQPAEDCSCPDCDPNSPLPCPKSTMKQVCDKHNDELYPPGTPQAGQRIANFMDCYDMCKPSFCCIHDSISKELAPTCANKYENCELYYPCYIIWWKLHDTIGPATYLRVEQDEPFYENLNFEMLEQDFAEDETFFNQLFAHHFDTDDPPTDDTFEDSVNW